MDYQGDGRHPATVNRLHNRLRRSGVTIVNDDLSTYSKETVSLTKLSLGTGSKAEYESDKRGNHTSSYPHWVMGG